MENKYQEAFRRIVDNSNLNIIVENGTSMNQDTKDVLLVQELVDKATPKKPIEMVIEEKYSEIYVVYQCPNCKKELFSPTLISDNRFCRTCGQATDWNSNE